MSAVLIVEDEEKIARLLRDYLEAAGFQVECVSDGRAALARVRAQPPRLVLLDLMLPGLGGLEVCKAMRAFSDVPIIMVTAMVEETDRLLGLDAGADDYVCKPFSPREVVARVKAVLRRPRASSTGGGVRVVGPFVLDDERMRISLDGRQLELTPGEYRVLRRFLRSPGRVFSRAQLLAELHPGHEDSFDRAIDTHVKNLRKRLGPSAHLLRSVYGVGYALELD